MQGLGADSASCCPLQEQTARQLADERAKHVAQAKWRLLWRTAPRIAGLLFQSHAFNALYWHLTNQQVCRARLS